MRFLLFALAFLAGCISLCNASMVWYNIPIITNISYNHSIEYEQICSVWDNSSNQTINYTSNITFFVPINLSFKIDWIGSDTVKLAGGNYSSNNSYVVLSPYNSDLNYTVKIERQDANFVYLRFNSQYDIPENIDVWNGDKNYSFEVWRDSLIPVPKYLNYSKTNVSDILKMHIIHRIIGSNTSGEIITDLSENSTFETAIVKRYVQSIPNMAVLEDIYSYSKYPIVNVTVTGDPSISYAPSISGNKVTTQITPKYYGTYNHTYTLTDVLGNKRDVSSEIGVDSLGEYFFRDINIPSLVIGEDAKVFIFDGKMVPMNFSVLAVDYFPREIPQPFNQSNVTIATPPPIVNPESLYVMYIQEGSGARRYFQPNVTVYTESNTLELGFMVRSEGEYSIRIKVEHDKNIRTNDEFKIHVRTGNVSIFENQSINVVGRVTSCEIVKERFGIDNIRRCSVDFPFFTEQELSNDLVMMARKDFSEYELRHASEIQKVTDDLTRKADRLREFRNIFITIFILNLITLIYIITPWDSLIVTNR